MDVAVIGDIFCDILVSNLKDLPQWGQDTLSEISILPGGSALNTTVHAANYSRFRDANVSICLFSATGNDSQGQICREVLKKEKIVDATLIKDGRTGSCIVLSGTDRAFISDRGCIDDMTLEWFGDLKLDERNVCHLHCAGYYNCSALRESLPTLFRTAKESGLTTSLNPQYDATQRWDGIQNLCPDIDILFCNEMEAAALTKENDLERSAKVLLSFGCKHVVITQSSHGCTVFQHPQNQQSQHEDQQLTASSSAHQPAFYVENPLDSTGAGDAFVGGFLVEWARSGRDMKSSLRAGCLTGAGAVTQIGGSTVPGLSVLSEYDASAPPQV